MSRLRPSGWIDWSFEVALALKGITGLVELFAGALLLLTPPRALQAWVRVLTQGELAADPHDFLFTHLRDAVVHLSGSSQAFAALYVLAHGVVKLVLVAAVLRNKRWAYLWMIGVLVAFIGYQSYRFVVAPSWGMAALTVFDLVIVALTAIEYRKQRTRAAPARAGAADGRPRSSSAKRAPGPA